MSAGRVLTAALLLLHASLASAQIHEGKTIVQARLVADTVRVQPGAPFTAAVHLTVAPGWHVYWENPGDTALPIQVLWEIPEDATTSPLRWPAPERYQEQGGITVFGYERETQLLSTVSPPARLTAESFTVQAKADWLVCEKVCLPGEAALSLTLPVGTASPSVDAPAIHKFAAMVPVDGAAAGIRMARARARKAGDRWLFTLDVDVPRGQVQAFFPRRIDGFAIEHGAIAVKGRTVELPALPDEADSRPRRVSGVAVTDIGTFDVSAAVSVEGPASEEGSAAPPDETPPAAKETPDPAADISPAPAAALPTDDWLDREFTTTVASREMPLLTLLALALAGGLLLNVMPCVLPVISLKVLGFVHQAGHDARRTRALGLMFAAGVVVSFWILAGAVVAVRATGEQIGWGFQFQSPAFVVAMAVVVLVFAMNLFGVFEISGPALSGAAGGQGRSGAFVHGTLATVLATPCTAPFLGTAIGFAFTQSASILFLAFTAAAVGLALPYVVLSWNPRWLRWLPRPGTWMVRFKQAMGFVLLATLVWLLSIIGAQLGPEGVVWTLAFLTIVAFAVWMIGAVPDGAGRLRRRAWTAAGAVIVTAGYVWTLEMELRWQAPVDAPLTAQSADGLAWKPFSLADLRARVERGETVFVDFTADWCWSCKVNERAVLSTAAVEARMRELNVTPVKADWTARNPEITRLLAKFGRAGVPFYAVFPAGRLTAPIGLSEVITPASVIEALDRAGASRDTVQP